MSYPDRHAGGQPAKLLEPNREQVQRQPCLCAANKDLGSASGHERRFCDSSMSGSTLETEQSASRDFAEVPISDFGRGTSARTLGRLRAKARLTKSIDPSRTIL